MPKSNVDPVAHLARIQGPVRHAWWLFWNRQVSAAYSSGMPPWAVNLLGSVARLERLTR